MSTSLHDRVEERNGGEEIVAFIDLSGDGVILDGSFSVAELEAILEVAKEVRGSCA